MLRPGSFDKHLPYKIFVTRVIMLPAVSYFATILDFLIERPDKAKP